MAQTPARHIFGVRGTGLKIVRELSGKHKFYIFCTFCLLTKATGHSHSCLDRIDQLGPWDTFLLLVFFTMTNLLWGASLG